MASAASAAEEEPREREKHRWSENSKVYTRKNFKNRNNSNTINNNTVTDSSAPVSSVVLHAETATTNNQDNENNNNNENKGIEHVDNGSPAHEIEIEKEKEKEKEIEEEQEREKQEEQEKEKEDAKENENEDAKELEKEDAQQELPSSPALPAEEANSSQPQQISNHLETASEDSSILNRTEAPVPNGHDVSLENGSVKPVMTRVDDRVSISVSAARSKEAYRELKRKLEDELGQVRKMAKRLEEKEIQVNGYSSSGIDAGVCGVDVGVTAPVVSSLQFPANGGMEKAVGGGGRMNVNVGSNGSRLFRQLSVSVVENSHGVGEVVDREKRTPKANQYYRNSEFILGKEKLPPAESKKSKSSGKKHGNREMDYGFGADKQLFKKCSNLLQKLMKHKLGWVFNEPVDVRKLGLHDYFDIIKHPMDLGTVKTRLAKNWYKTPREFAEDIRLTFHNAMTYNPEGQDVHFMAKELLRMFEERWPAIETEYDHKLRYEMIRNMGAPTPTSRKRSAPTHVHASLHVPPPPILHHPPSFQEARHLGRSHSMPVPPESRTMPAYLVRKTPAPKKPKAKDPHKRDMTFEEKQRLSTNLQSLPAEKLDAIVQIIKKRNTALSQHDDEIEVDIDSVDTETLWELDRFVTNYRKNLSKHKRKAERALQQARAVAAQGAQEPVPNPVITEAAKETREGGEVNISTSPAQQERHSDNASGSSSSGSSSSDSGSSTSDSDSDSSSSSGSEEEQ